MDDNNQPPPPIPDRPGRPPRIQSIESIIPENRANDYVDSTTVTQAITGSPKRPPKVHTLAKPKTQEGLENVSNEQKERFQSCKQKQSKLSVTGLKSPELPPRSNRAPPLPPRTVANSNHGLSRPVVTSSHQDASDFNQSFNQCNLPSERLHRPGPTRSSQTSGNRNSKKLQPSVLIITTGEPQRFTLRKHEKPPRETFVTQQPLSANNRDITLTLDQSGALNNTIICRKCGRCRCSHCTGHRKLPERWLCEGNCKCSADSVVDTLSCMWCVKTCFKNSCIDNPDGQRVDPCSCTESPKCLLRWTAMAAMSLCLPCLCCYWPMRLGVSAATACYNSPCCRNRGCNCEDDET